MKLYLLVKKKGSKRWLGAIPAKKNAKPSKLKQLAKATRSNYIVKVINQSQLKRLLAKRIKTRLMGKRKTKKKRQRNYKR